MTQKLILVLGALYGGLAVFLGAFGAHGLNGKLGAELLDSYETGVRYQFYHALALLLVGLLMSQMESPLMRWAGGCFALGTLLFSGSVYLLSTRPLLPLGELRFLGPVTPLGGLLLIAGWILLAVAVGRSPAH
ncbi:MAG: DUF423 domain-containing protein [Lentisphaerae bacterium]|nr:DUF423 domain-containing protein [Lentisphaerota bacterium]